MTLRRRGRVAAGLQVAGIPVLSVGLGVIALWIGVAALGAGLMLLGLALEVSSIPRRAPQSHIVAPQREDWDGWPAAVRGAEELGFVAHTDAAGVLWTLVVDCKALREAVARLRGCPAAIVQRVGFTDEQILARVPGWF